MKNREMMTGQSGVLIGSSPVVLIMVIKSMRMRWAGHVARMGEIWNGYKTLAGEPKEKKHYFGKLDVDGRII